MTDNKEDEPLAGEDTLEDRLRAEAGHIEWSDLVRHFARGVVVCIAAELDLVEVAECMANDDTARMEGWLAQSLVRRASDDDARDWHARQPRFVCVVTAPWVLVQEAENHARH